jgi:hypothetical protein
MENETFIRLSQEAKLPRTLKNGPATGLVSERTTRSPDTPPKRYAISSRRLAQRCACPFLGFQLSNERTWTVARCS